MLEELLGVMIGTVGTTGTNGTTGDEIFAVGSLGETLSKSIVLRREFTIFSLDSFCFFVTWIILLAVDSDRVVGDVIVTDGEICCSDFGNDVDTSVVTVGLVCCKPVSGVDGEDTVAPVDIIDVLVTESFVTCFAFDDYFIYLNRRVV